MLQYNVHITPLTPTCDPISSVSMVTGTGEATRSVGTDSISAAVTISSSTLIDIYKLLFSASGIHYVKLNSLDTSLKNLFCVHIGVGIGGHWGGGGICTPLPPSKILSYVHLQNSTLQNSFLRTPMIHPISLVLRLSSKSHMVI